MSREDENGRSIEMIGLHKKGEENQESIELFFDVEIAKAEFRRKHKKEIDDLAKEFELIYE